ncbi:MAG: hypothetical protein MUF06_03670 [Pirellulaceae bacterium]|jgi:hypothetical protein|nr:hypothetical protein [Pirellulaceae bacterium]
MNRSKRQAAAGASTSRRTLLQGAAAAVLAAATTAPRRAAADETCAKDTARPWIAVRGVYGGYLREILARGQTPADYGINAVWVGSGSLNAEEIDRYHKLGLQVFAEFNSMHAAEYLREHPDAAPIGPDGRPAPPPQGWQGVSPFHPGYRSVRMQEFRRVLKDFAIDGIWLDYHHAHASWERAEPELPDTDFSPLALRQFSTKTGIELPADVAAAAKVLLGERREAWTDFRCAVFTDWVREYREILDEVRPRALLGTFHCPWSPEDYGGAIRHKLAINLPAQSPYLDVFSIMPYHARFGHADDPAWIARQIEMLGKLLHIEGQPQEKQRIWPIVQLSDWGPSVPVEQVERVIELGTRRPATGIMAFHWSGISQQWDKVEALKRAYLAYRA